MVVEIKSYYYEASKSEVVQGNRSVVDGYISEGYFIKQGSHGSYRMCKPSVATVDFVVDDSKELHTQSVKQIIRDCYGVKNVTLTRLEKFVKDCDEKVFELKYSETEGLYL